MTDNLSPWQNLEALWHNEFPLARAMQIRVAGYADHLLTTRTPLTDNTNIHGSAFAGSLYAIQALTAWSLLYLELEAAGLPASIIHARGTIDFARPVNQDIIASASFAGHDHVLRDIAATGKARLTLSAGVYVGDLLAIQFSGDYVIRALEA
jgi:thioesterase domain-containing protein